MTTSSYCFVFDDNNGTAEAHEVALTGTEPAPVYARGVYFFG